METIAENRCFGGTQKVITHRSEACDCDMTFGLFLPEEAQDGPVPVLWYLSGLTCTHENAMTKAGAQAYAAETGIALVFPDTSPRGEGVANDDAYDLGQGAGFYIDATQDPWSKHFKMWTYTAEELPKLLGDTQPLDMDRQGITGHSMGGHGALTLGMALKGRFRSISAFSPICNPTQSDWGRKQFAAYWGDEANWGPHDATLLMQGGGFDGPILIDTGTDDQFGDLLMTENFAQTAMAQRQECTVRLQQGYDHSYFFVSTFIPDHIAFHAEALYRFWVDADACPVKAEVEKVATRRRVKVAYVSNGGLRPSQNPLIEHIYVDQGADVADMYIADHATAGDVVVTNDIPLAARAVEGGALVLKPNGEALTAKNVGQALATRDLMTDLRAADPFRQGGGKAFSKSDRSRFLDALDRLLTQAERAIS